MKRLLAAIILVGIAGLLVWAIKPSRAAPPPGFVAVLKVSDGDTFEVALGGHAEKVRMIGVDTPETVDPRRPIQCFGKEASNYSKEVLRGQNVRLETDTVAGDRDKYHRLLRYVYLANGVLYNQDLIAQGYAHEYTYRSQPYLHQAEFKVAERLARESGHGLWNKNSCNGDTKQSA